MSGVPPKHLTARIDYRAPGWLPEAHSQTIYPALFGRTPTPAYRREEWCTPDGDFIDVDWLATNGTPTAQTPLVVLFHGLEGGSDSHYARALMAALNARGWRGVVPHFRGCGGRLNQAPRFYHSGDSAEADWILRRLRSQHAGPIFAAGVSLGGNVLLCWLGRQGTDANAIVDAACAISAPLDLNAGGAALGRGFNRIYTRNFLATLKKKSLAKLLQYPGLFDRDAMLAAPDLAAFDNVVTAPLHGFRDTLDYWTRASSKPLLPAITLPTLVLNARNDPFLPAAHLPGPAEVGAHVELLQPAQGGHVGFMTSPFPGRLSWLPDTVLGYFGKFIRHG